MRLCADLGHRVIEADLPGLDDRVSHAIGRWYSGAISWIIDYWTGKIGHGPGDDDLEPFTRVLWETAAPSPPANI